MWQKLLPMLQMQGEITVFPRAVASYARCVARSFPGINEQMVGAMKILLDYENGEPFFLVRPLNQMVHVVDDQLIITAQSVQVKNKKTFEKGMRKIELALKGKRNSKSRTPD